MGARYPVTISLTEDERALVDEAAKAVEVKRSVMMRQAILAHARRVLATPQEK